MACRVQNEANLLMHLHSIKYHQFDCLGLLLGRQEADKQVVIERAIPLFHQRVTSGVVEIAFDMVQSLFLEQGQQIVGLYEAAMPLSLPDGREHSTVAQYLLELI